MWVQQVWRPYCIVVSWVLAFELVIIMIEQIIENDRKYASLGYFINMNMDEMFRLFRSKNNNSQKNPSVSMIHDTRVWHSIVEEIDDDAGWSKF
jgi:hypothetical protein